LFLGSHPAIDFLNTYMEPRGEPKELLGEGRALVEWLTGAGLMDAASSSYLVRRFGAAALDEAAADARRFRERVRAWIARWQENPAGDHRAEFRHLNGVLATTTVHWELVATPRGRELVERYPITAAEQLVGRVAVEVARLIAREDPTLIKRCAGPDCTLWFLDRTKARRRLFCSAATCGNRAKVAAFRQRQRLP